jgi:ribose 5-phosphate isomerase B
MKTVVLGSDHAGFESKEQLKKHLTESDYTVIDVGTDSLESCNYADYAIKAAEVVASRRADFGIVICGTGEGVSIAANKVKGIRCGIGYNDDVSRLLRNHNDANMIAFGARYMSVGDIIRRSDIFLNSQFDGGRHEVRIQSIIKYESK